ncbi:MAG: ATP-binding cassette domain-containing protein [Candidatus Puniceispirillales bacterium]
MHNKDKLLENEITPIVADNLSVSFGNINILNDVSFKIENKNITAVIGPNGAGKSVLLQTINGLTNIQKGKITFNSFLHSDDIRKKQALVFQYPTLLRRSVLSNMEFIAEIYKNADRKIIQNTLIRCGLDGYDQKSARLLSGGEKQRLSLARALLTEPSVLLLDEPTANLDPFSLKLIEDIILEENKKGTCIILTTHDMAQAKRLATNIIFMNKGKVIEQKKSETFFNKPETNEALKYVKGEILL